MIRVISLHQPFASALFVPEVKVHETRSWKPPASLIGDTLGIQAAKTEPRVDEFTDALCVAVFGSNWRRTLPYGQFIGTTHLEGFKPMDSNAPLGGAASILDYWFGDWSPGRFHWVLTERTALTSPEPMKGQQGIWRVDR